MPERIRILVVDDHAGGRSGLVTLVRQTFPAALVAETSDGADALQKCLSEAWDMVILDLSLPKLSGVEVLRRALRERPGLRVLVLSMYLGPQYGPLTLKLGARGYLSKDSVPQAFESALRAVIKGETYLDPLVANPRDLTLAR